MQDNGSRLPVEHRPRAPMTNKLSGDRKMTTANNAQCTVHHVGIGQRFENLYYDGSRDLRIHCRHEYLITPVFMVYFSAQFDARLILPLPLLHNILGCVANSMHKTLSKIFHLTPPLQIDPTIKFCNIFLSKTVASNIRICSTLIQISF